MEKTVCLFFPQVLFITNMLASFMAAKFDLGFIYFLIVFQSYMAEKVMCVL